MENEEHSWEKFDDERSLSFRNLSMPDNIQSPTNHLSTTEESVFQFELPISLFQDTIFYDENEHLNEYQKRDYLTVVRSNSFSNSRPSLVQSKDDVGSFRYSYSSKQSLTNSYSVHNKKKVNITSLTSMSDKSRRRMFMFGPVKFEPEMELNAIKERQGRRNRPIPETIFPVAAAEEDSGKMRALQGKRKRSKMMRSIKGTVHVAAVLARSVACIPLSIAAMAHKH